jgi:hypothetical protein
MRAAPHISSGPEIPQPAAVGRALQPGEETAIFTFVIPMKIGFRNAE